ncbi:hypothetical protein NKL06_10950 [Mesorhizobium sp. C268A]|nr:hypothetical protein [Mesorhizobium sp. LSJC268A00]
MHCGHTLMNGGYRAFVA